MSVKTARRYRSSLASGRPAGVVWSVGTSDVRLLASVTAGKEPVYRGYRVSAPVDDDASVTDQWLHLQTLASRIGTREDRLSRLGARIAPVRAAVETLAPSFYVLRRPFEVVIEPTDDGFLACFYAANISASGDNQTEAYANLKDLIVAMWELLEETAEAELGPEPARQRAVLREYIAR
jgi:hypothetical protein